MSNVKITQLFDLPLWDWLTGDVQLGTAERRMATFSSAQSDYLLKIDGQNFEYDSSTFVDGIVNRISFFDENDKLTLRVEGDYSVRELNDYLHDGDPFAFQRFLFSFDDKFTGSKVGDYLDAGTGNDEVSGLGGDDEIIGGRGKDMLTGGRGSDVFFFATGDGKDTITDFDAVGGIRRQDHFSLTDVTFDALEFRKQGDNVLVDLGGGDVLRLLDVKLRDIDETDFQPPLELQL